MSPRHFLDTNILLYSISGEPNEIAKRDRAIELLDLDGGALSVQVLQEFYVQATRATRPDPIPHNIAVDLIRKWIRFVVQDVTLQILERALQIKLAHGFSYWDSAIIAAAAALGCQTLYSEDMSHGRHIEGVMICNPFI
ncbi:MAG: PIN domain-containing protein [Beijerinckiaceae bacterium]